LIVRFSESRKTIRKARVTKLLIDYYFNSRHEILKRHFDNFIAQTLEYSNIILKSIEHIASEESQRA
jgi:hypothetical protein